MSKLALGVLVSGNGTNLQAILDAIAEGSLNGEVRLVLSNKAGVYALTRAEQAGVRTEVLPHRDFESREAFDEAMVDALRAAGCEWIVLAGFMRLVTPIFLRAFPWRIVNIHPALLPAFPGVHAVRQALDYGVKVTGCTVHLVDEGTDTGPIIGQRAIPVLEDDTLETLEERVHTQEHQLFVEVLRWIADGRVSVVAGDAERRPRVEVRPA